MSNPFLHAFKDAGLISEDQFKEAKKKQQQEKELYDKKGKYGNLLSLYPNFSLKKDEKEIDPKFFNEIPQQIIGEYFLGKNARGDTFSKITSTKLRQYYDMINGLYQLNLDGDTLKSELYMILAKANYDLGRKKIVPEEFVEFLRINIDIVFDKGDVIENFKVFKKHFEALVAYAKGKLTER